MEIPSTEWREADWTPAEVLAWAPLEADWRALPGLVRHGFTHFRLELRVWAGATSNGAAEGRWLRPEDLGAAALPTLMRKVVRHALDATAATEP